MNGIGEVGKFERQYLRISQTHHHDAGGLRQGAAVSKIGVFKVREPVEIVVYRVVLPTASVLAAKADIQAGDPQMVGKDGKVGAGTEGADAQVGT